MQVGGVVLDPFCGSGTTLKVAKLKGYNYIGIDINPEYVQIANEILNKTPCAGDIFENKI
jgi:site-specific DNA-methyltransferase (adenine-specific)